MAHDDLTTPSLDDFTREQLCDLTESSATARIFRQLVSHCVQDVVDYFDEEAGEQKVETYAGFLRVFEQNRRLNKVEATAWLDGDEDVAELINICGGEVPEPYASLPVRLIGLVKRARAHGMRYPHMREYQFFEISDSYSELDGSSLITYQKYVYHRDDEYCRQGDMKILAASGARDLTKVLVKAHFEGDDAI